MANKSHKIIIRSKKRIFLKSVFFYSFIIIIMLSLIEYYHPDNKFISSLFFASLIIWIVLNFISGFFINSYKNDGDLHFSETKIIINDKTFKLSEISSIKTIVNDYSGKAYKGMYFGIGSMYPSEGIDNFFMIETNSDENFKLQFILKFKNEIVFISKMLEYYERMGIKTEFNKKNDL